MPGRCPASRTIGRAPADQRRAPLRQRRRDRPGLATDVFPPVSGGLHCGGSCMIGDDRPMARAPAGHRRAPLRRVGPMTWPRYVYGSVLPPITGGLHCGLTAVQRPGRWRCSRRSAAGSIAARRPAGTADRHACSRRPAAGSIAAVAGGPWAGARRPARHGAGVPAGDRRAPLRRDWTGPACGWRRVFPPMTGGLHCGAATGDGPAIGWQVFPPVTGGLHCGAASDGVAGCVASGVPADQRRAPLRREPARSGDPEAAGAPADHRRAPLRRATHGTCAQAGDPVLPPSSAGSIAAARASARHRDSRACSRRSPAGSIAAP